MPGDDLATFSGHIEHLDVPVRVRPGKKTAHKIDGGVRVKAFLRKRWGLAR